MSRSVRSFMLSSPLSRTALGDCVVMARSELHNLIWMVPVSSGIERKREPIRKWPPGELPACRLSRSQFGFATYSLPQGVLVKASGISLWERLGGPIVCMLGQESSSPILELVW